MHLLLITALPAWLTYAFYALVAWGVAAVLAAFRALSTGTRMSVLLRLGFGVWLVVPAYLANAGVLSQFDAMPPMLVRVVVPLMKGMEAEADAAGLDFVRSMYPNLRNFLPQ